MNTTHCQPTFKNLRSLLPGLAVGCALALGGGPLRASQAYGTVNNFDVVNDNGVPTHGFEIELDDIHTKDITYTFDYNHYGTPKMSEGSPTIAGSTNAVFIRYQSVWTNTGWSAYTAVPAGPIPPTQGHQFTNPRTNFGGEHFGVGYRAQPTKVTYFWLVDNGTHVLTRGGQVNVTTPVFTYSPPVGAVQAQAVAVIPAPVPPVPPSYEFSGASWVKVVTTTSQTNNEVKIGDLMTPDTNNPNAKDWRNGQTNVEVETEWQLLQIDYMSSDYNPTNGLGGQNAKLAGPNRGLGHSDDVVTYRYEYYAYVGPYDDFSEPPTHEAFAQTVAKDGIHGTGTYSNTIVVGKFLGAQMSAMAAAAPVGLIDHLPDGQINVAYPTRSVVIAGDTNFTASLSGTLPTGMAFDAVNGWVYGTPSTAGIFIVTVTVSVTNRPALTKTYPFMVGAGAILPPHSAVDIGVSDTNAGTASGNGVYTNSTATTVTATPRPGFAFTGWTENDAVVSTTTSYTFTNIVNRSLKATFRHQPKLDENHALPGQRLLRWPTNDDGFVLEENTSMNPAGWVTSTNVASIVGTNYQINYPMTGGARFYRLRHP
jgi:hypothetical protein